MDWLCQSAGGANIFTAYTGKRIYNPHKQVYLVCAEGGHYILQTLDNLFFYFGEVPDTNSEVPLQRIENALGHFLHLGFRSSMMERAAKL
ncbi:hypothetical protein V0R52_27925 [Pseudomonas asiatica]|uniref:hypothetical protein n=1 Tax=Pseudomonas asiatica TaxID=2219225 RepID=UPI002E7BD578|nr:hypothetical protein [Pseudomonas asiatica]MEE1920219.1 hypothetical protein [Pseudomonas asiatica]